MYTLGIKKIILLLVIVLSAVAVFAYASSQDDITYPVAELGGCGNKEECKTYCDASENFGACFAFAKKHNLIKGVVAEEVEVEHIDQFSKVLQEKGGPGGCTNHKQCEDYCNNADNMLSCMQWAEENGVLRGAALEETKRVRSALEKGVALPKGCTNRRSCDAYCSDANNIDECLAFAEQSGFLPEKELEQAKKFAEHMKRGETPGGCRSKEECEAYCFEGNNFDECFAFAEKSGIVPQEELEVFKKTGGRGPGGCRGRECEAFCLKPENQDTCFRWAEENGLLKAEELGRFREHAQEFKAQFEQMPPEVAQCLKETVGEEVLNKLLSGEPVFDRALGEKMKSCFERVAQQSFTGPGGCATPEECIRYCAVEEHAAECEGFQSKFAGPSKGRGPGGCATVEECREYCKANPSECEAFISEGVPAETKCPQGFELAQDNKGMKYCAQSSCPEGQVFGTDQFGRRFCKGSLEQVEQKQPLPFPERKVPSDLEEQYRKQYEEQYRMLPPSEDQTQPYPGPNIAPEQYDQYKQQYEDQYRQQYQQQYEQYQKPPQDYQQYQQYQAPTSQPQSRLNPPTLGELLLGLVSALLF